MPLSPFLFLSRILRGSDKHFLFCQGWNFYLVTGSDDDVVLTALDYVVYLFLFWGKAKIELCRVYHGFGLFEALDFDALCRLPLSASHVVG